MRISSLANKQVLLRWYLDFGDLVLGGKKDGVAVDVQVNFWIDWIARVDYPTPMILRHQSVSHSSWTSSWFWSKHEASQIMLKCLMWQLRHMLVCSSPPTTTTPCTRCSNAFNYFWHENASSLRNPVSTSVKIFILFLASSLGQLRWTCVPSTIILGQGILISSFRFLDEWLVLTHEKFFCQRHYPLCPESRRHVWKYLKISFFEFNHRLNLAWYLNYDIFVVSGSGYR